MDVVVLFNGLGNQMSQYSFYLGKKYRNKSTYFITFCNDHNGFELGRLFSIKNTSSIRDKALYVLFRILLTKRGGKIWTSFKNVLGKLGVKIVYENFDYSFKPINMVESKGINFYFGGWHSEKYFHECKKMITENFNFSPPNDAINSSYIDKILNTNSVSIHIRRGDYLSDDNLRLFGDVCTPSYFHNAIDYINKRVKEPHFFIFSNDISWAKENLQLGRVTYISENLSENSWKDMYLMTICKHNIVANSTFSWWGAWLNKNYNNIIICPERFLRSDIFTDVYPDSWIKVPS